MCVVTQPRCGGSGDCFCRVLTHTEPVLLGLALPRVAALRAPANYPAPRRLCDGRFANHAAGSEVSALAGLTAKCGPAIVGGILQKTATAGIATAVAELLRRGGSMIIQHHVNPIALAGDGNGILKGRLVAGSPFRSSVRFTQTCSQQRRPSRQAGRLKTCPDRCVR